MPDLYALLGRRVKAERKARHLTQQELSDASGVDVTQLSRLENGKDRPSLNTVQKLADAFGIAIGALFSDVPAREVPDQGWARKMGEMVRDMSPRKRAKVLRVLKSIADD